jgi:hypothetical protein
MLKMMIIGAIIAYLIIFLFIVARNNYLASKGS